MSFTWPDLLIKPIPALVLAFLAWSTGGRASRRLSIGLYCAALGDELLLRDDRLFFLAGMLCFAAMQGFYISSYIALTVGRIKPRPYVNVALTIAVTLIVLKLAPHAGSLAWPLVAYSIVLALMVLFALDLVGRIDREFSLLIAGGALTFMLSDTLLAFEKFYPGFPLAGVTGQMVVLGTYYAAQIAIASGVMLATRVRATGS